MSRHGVIAVSDFGKALLGRFDKKKPIALILKTFIRLLRLKTNGLLGECGLFSEVMCVF
jgi:hypothetical protein